MHFWDSKQGAWRCDTELLDSGCTAFAEVGETTFGGATSAQCEAGYTKVDIEDDSTVSAGSATISILRWKCECATNQCTRTDAAGEVLHDVLVYYEFRAQMESGSAEDMPEAAAKIAEMYGQNQASRGEELDTQTDGDAASGSAASALNCNQEDRSGCGDWSKKGCVLQSWDELQVMQDIQANFASALSNQSQQLNVCQDPSFYWWPRKLTFNPDKANAPKFISWANAMGINDQTDMDNVQFISVQGRYGDAAEPKGFRAEPLQVVIAMQILVCNETEVKGRAALVPINETFWPGGLGSFCNDSFRLPRIDATLRQQISKLRFGMVSDMVQHAEY